MPRLRIKARMGQIGDPRAAGRAIQVELRKQWLERFATGGTSDGQGKAWQPLRHREGQPLVDQGTLRNTTRESLTIHPNRASVQFGSSMTGPIPWVHQFGTRLGKDIVPVSAKALFIPLTGAAKRSTLEGGRRVGQTGSRSGRRKRPKELKINEDFILRRRIPATPEKGGRAIPARPFARVTEKNSRDLVQAVSSSQRR